MATIDKALLLSVKASESDVTFPIDDDTSGTVRVRGMSRDEWFTVGKIAGEHPDADKARSAEAFILSVGMVEPTLSLDEAKEFLHTAPMRTSLPILEKIRVLSGVGDHAQKEAYKSIRD